MNPSKKRRIKVKTKKIANSFKYAIQGFFASLRTEKNMKIHIFIMILVIILGNCLKLSNTEWMICIILFVMVISGELFNTAIETTVDIAMPQKNKKAKLAKDISASAVLVLAIGAAIVGIMIFLPKITNTIK